MNMSIIQPIALDKFPEESGAECWGSTIDGWKGRKEEASDEDDDSSTSPM